jgi:DNA-binding NarL/FixJ family response regulator
MATEFTTCGGSHLAKTSQLVAARVKLGPARDVLVIEDETQDAERLAATLRVIFGYELRVHLASSPSEAVDKVVESKPSLVFLDDILKPSANALQTMPLLRGAGYEGPIIVISGEVTHSRRSSLLAGGASDVIHKDDVDSVRVAEAIAHLDLKA